jgi:eukaryotic-like serine/threonine-protein kinase
MADRADQVSIDDRYSYIDSLGAGGMARVVLAHDPVLDREVAIKVLREQYAEDPQFVERFRREAQSAAALAHPNIVSIYDLGRSSNGAYYIAMEHVPGGTLKQRLEREGRLSVVEAAAIGGQIADALDAAHRYGVVHRDIKPQNVLLTGKGEARVADFGIARAASVVAGSGTSLVLGTASYMSPEQAAGETLGPRSDLYSLGVVLYELLTGRLPFEAETPVALAFKQVYEEPVPPAEVEPSVSEGMNALVMKLLAKNPADRYESAAEVSGELERIQDGQAPVDANPPVPADATLPTAGGVPRRRQRFPLALLGVVATLALVALIFYLGLDETRQPDTGQAGNVAVPDLVGMQLPEAREALDEAGLELGAVQETASSSALQGEILAQSPAPDVTVERGETVDVTVSSGSGSGGPAGGGGGGGSGGPGADFDAPGVGGNQYSGSGS